MIPDFSDRINWLLKQYANPSASVADLLCDRHPGDSVAFTVIDADLSHRKVTYGELRKESTKFALALDRLGVTAGDSVAVLMSKSAELVIALLGIWRRGAVHVPLFTAFASPAIEMRVNASSAKLVLCDAGQLDKVTILKPGAKWQVMSVDAPAESDVLDFYETLNSVSETEARNLEPVAIGGAGHLIRIFTSGTTGTPKCVPIPLRALAALEMYHDVGLNVTENDVYWNSADPGWAYGLYYGILTPLLTGRRNLLLHAPFSPELTWSVLEQFQVTNFAAAPTVYRALRAADLPPLRHSALRRASSAGEPLTPEVTEWALNALGVEVRDQYGQTETGMTVVNAWHEDFYKPVRTGSMGVAMPGWTIGILSMESDEVAETGTIGRVAISVKDSPLMHFEGYIDAPEKSAERFTDDGQWYLSGDAGSVDLDGNLFFSARADDVIIMAGYRIGPFDVESVLLQHPSVAEAAVIGVPDEIRGEVIEAFVVLNDRFSESCELVDELQEYVKKNFAAHAYPRSVHFAATLPKTASGKIQRFALRKIRNDEIQSEMSKV